MNGNKSQSELSENQHRQNSGQHVKPLTNLCSRNHNEHNLKLKKGT